jgi:phosphate uptake regulator
MKGSKSKIDRKFWDMVFGKLKKLGTAIEMYYGGDMDIDNQEYRWVDDRIRYYENDYRLLTKQEMQIANLYWKKYGT